MSKGKRRKRGTEELAAMTKPQHKRKKRNQLQKTSKTNTGQDMKLETTEKASMCAPALSAPSPSKKRAKRRFKQRRKKTLESNPPRSAHSLTPPLSLRACVARGHAALIRYFDSLGGGTDGREDGDKKTHVTECGFGSFRICHSPSPSSKGRHSLKSSSKGRHLVATRDLAAGTVLFTEPAVVFSGDDLTDYCVACGACIKRQLEGEDEGEEETDAEIAVRVDKHRETCAEFRTTLGGFEMAVDAVFDISMMACDMTHELAPDAAPPPLLSLIKIISALRKPSAAAWALFSLMSHDHEEANEGGTEGSSPGSDGDEDSADEAMRGSQGDERSMTTRATEMRRRALRAACSMCWALLPQPHIISLQSAHFLLGVLERNAHSANPDGCGAGSGLFPLTAMLNHACRENCVFSTTGHPPRMQVRTLRPVRKNEELCVSYLDHTTRLSPTLARKSYLQRCYSFECRCERCGEGGRDVVRAFRCPGKGKRLCNGIVCPVIKETSEEWVCSSSSLSASSSSSLSSSSSSSPPSPSASSSPPPLHCKWKCSPKEHRQFVSAEVSVRKWLDEQEAEIDGWQEHITPSKKTPLTVAMQIMHPSHHLHLRRTEILAEARFETGMTLQSNDDPPPSRTIGQALASMETRLGHIDSTDALPPAHPLKIGELDSLASYYWRAGKFDKADQMFSRAYRMCCLCFGEESFAARECRQRSKAYKLTHG